MRSGDARKWPLRALLAALKMPRRHSVHATRCPRSDRGGLLRDELTTLVREVAALDGAAAEHRLSLQHLLAAAGSSPAASAAAIARMAGRHPDDERWTALLSRCPGRRVRGEGSCPALLRLLAQNSAEEESWYLYITVDSMTHIANQLAQRKMSCTRVFSGDMSRPRKDEAVEAFRDQVPVLLCAPNRVARVATFNSATR